MKTSGENATPNATSSEHHIWGSVEISTNSSKGSSGLRGSSREGSAGRENRQARIAGKRSQAKSSSKVERSLAGVVFHSESDCSGSLPDGEVQRGASWSAGSEFHHLGQCNPCAWNWRPAGCVNGQDCKFCHTCAEGALKSRRKERVAKLKAERAAQCHQDRDGRAAASAAPTYAIQRQALHSPLVQQVGNSVPMMISGGPLGCPEDCHVLQPHRLSL